jgi:dipeptidyl aminopeptidase/acylaminoacyl peptidase
LLSCGSRPPRFETVAAPGPGSAAPPISGELVPHGGAGAAGPEMPSTPVASGVLRLKGTPPIDAALLARLGPYLETRSATVNAIADDGRALLITTRFAQTEQVHLVRSPFGARTQLTFGTERARNASFVPGATNAVLFMADRGGDEQFQIQRLDSDTNQLSLLTDGKSRHGEYVWSYDGRRIAYTGNARNGKDMDVYVGDGRSAAGGTLFLERQGHWYPVEWSRDGKQLLIGEFVSINESRLYVVDMATKAVSRITPDAPAASYREAAFDPKARTVYVASDWGGEFVRLYALDVAKMIAKTPCAEGAAGKSEWPCLAGMRRLDGAQRWNVEDLALSPDGRTLAYVENGAGYGVLNLIDPATRAARRVQGIPKGIVSGLRFARGSGLLAFTLARSTEAGDAYSYDLKTGRVQRWTQSELGGLNPSRLAEPTLVHTKSFDGLEIPAFYYRPKAEGRRPVVINIHGGPEAQSRPSFSPLAQLLVAEANMAVLSPNVRGSDGYGKSYLLLDNGRKREDSVKDIGAWLDWIKQQPELDSSRVAVFGGSYGGYMVLASLIHFPDRIKAGVDVVGISNFVTFLENTKAYRRDLRRAEYGDERDPELRKFLTEISPANRAGRISSALFVAHGANDPRVPLAETDQIVEAVKKNEKDVWYMVAMNEGHGFDKKENRDTFYALAVSFLEKHLK